MRKILMIVLILSILILSGCENIDNKRERIDENSRLFIASIDCEHNVLCYRNPHYVGMSCVKVDIIEGCEVKDEGR